MSRRFTDTDNRPWTIELNVHAVKRVRDLLGVDLLDLGGSDGDKPEDQLVFRLIADPVLLVDVLYVVCQEQASAASVDDAAFGRAMAGDAIDAATRALLEELADFTPSPRDRARARKVIAATWELIDRAQDVLDGRIDATMAEAADAAIAAMTATPGGGSTSSPAASPSTPQA